MEHSICAGCGREVENKELESDEALCTACREALVALAQSRRQGEALEQLCADRPDLVPYVEGLFKQASVQEAGADPESATARAALGPPPQSLHHVRWRAFMSKLEPHIERCGRVLSEETSPLSASMPTAQPRPDWEDEAFQLTVRATMGGQLLIAARWHYGPPGDACHGLVHDYTLRLTGWERVVNLHWLRRVLRTSFDRDAEFEVSELLPGQRPPESLPELHPDDSEVD
jgi:hypothetical protein